MGATSRLQGGIVADRHRVSEFTGALVGVGRLIQALRALVGRRWGGLGPGRGCLWPLRGGGGRPVAPGVAGEAQHLAARLGLGGQFPVLGRAFEKIDRAAVDLGLEEDHAFIDQGGCGGGGGAGLDLHGLVGASGLLKRQREVGEEDVVVGAQFARPGQHFDRQGIAFEAQLRLAHGGQRRHQVGLALQRFGEAGHGVLELGPALAAGIDVELGERGLGAAEPEPRLEIIGQGLGHGEESLLGRKQQLAFAGDAGFAVGQGAAHPADFVPGVPQRRVSGHRAFKILHAADQVAATDRQLGVKEMEFAGDRGASAGLGGLEQDFRLGGVGRLGGQRGLGGVEIDPAGAPARLLVILAIGAEGFADGDRFIMAPDQGQRLHRQGAGLAIGAFKGQRLARMLPGVFRLARGEVVPGELDPAASPLRVLGGDRGQLLAGIGRLLGDGLHHRCPFILGRRIGGDRQRRQAQGDRQGEDETQVATAEGHWSGPHGAAYPAWRARSASAAGSLTGTGTGVNTRSASTTRVAGQSTSLTTSAGKRCHHGVGVRSTASPRWTLPSSSRRQVLTGISRGCAPRSSTSRGCTV